ncbi:hypothetical protein C5F48_22535 [Cereibacter changlensis JA139]|uniref:Uncharacterized protein n=1 Tax=Cereibacter changlensis JA139 TaxID=1188249 RepID=A0A2T4JNL7_9RHOB|nr:hypothetical protein [Cereibacter changlensis]PTE19509.1 hypothetical protein C5F48_22535 [Cereibacter changlensis JA139]
MPRDPNQLLVNAMRCLTAADVLLGSADYGADRKTFLLPVTLTIGNGLELLFKYNLVLQGHTLALLRERYDRDVFRLWKQPENAAIRLMARENFAHAVAALPDEFIRAHHHRYGKPIAELEHYLMTLARVLQSMKLRAPAESKDLTCCPWLLLDTFMPIASLQTLNPKWLTPDHFRIGGFREQLKNLDI